MRDAARRRVGRKMSAPVALLAFAVAVALLAPRAPAQERAPSVTVASKKFNESYILAEMMAQLLEAAGYDVSRRFGLGGTLVCYQALVNGEIDVYPEYTGTVERAILKLEGSPSLPELRRELRETHSLEFLAPFGFNNTYAIALARGRAEGLDLETIGDLSAHPDLTLAFSHEFIERSDGWPGLARTYDLPQTPAGIEHGLAYQAISDGKIDVTDVYSTDGDIEKYDLVLLDDDRAYFPTYLAGPLVRRGIDGGVSRVLGRLGGRIDAETMRGMNAEVLLEAKSFAAVAGAFLVDAGLVGTGAEGTGSWASTLLRRTIRHLELTAIALAAALLIAFPLGIVIYRTERLARPVLYVTGALQTIPSIALLAFMIPLFGIGAVPAIVALFLYALLPIVRNTAAALFSIDPVLKKVAVGMGLTGAQRLRHVEIPLAAPTILAGVKTAAVINIGTATLAAFIGAGGLGEPIVTGLALNDTGLILEGAVPAAVLAILTELFFEALERLWIPRHLLAQRAR